MNLSDNADFFESSNAFAHDGFFAMTIEDLLDCDWLRGTGVDNAFVILDWDEDS